MKVQSSLILIVCLMFPDPGSAEGPAFRFRKAIDRQTTGETIMAAVLDPEVHAATRDGYPDVRIVDEAGAEVPFLLEQANHREIAKVREACPSDVVSLRDRDGKSLEIVVQLRDQAPNADGLTIVTPLSDYEHRVKVFGAGGDRDWSSLVTDGLIFDYKRFMDVRNRDISLTANESRRFRVEIEQGLDALESPFRELARVVEEGQKEKRLEVTQIQRRPFRIDRIDLWRTVEKQSELKPVHMDYPVRSIAIEQDASEKVTRIALRTGREPLTGFRLVTSSRNFSRKVKVLIPVSQGVRTDWQELGQGTVNRTQIRGFHQEQLELSFPEKRSELYRIVIENADNPPLEITSVKAEGKVYRLIFMAEEGRRYHLEYGSDRADAPRYDTATVLASLGSGYQANVATLGPQVNNPGYRQGTGIGKLLDSSVVLFLALGLMIVVLGWLLFRAGKQIKKLPEADV
jgi:hypothetical protein